MSSFKQQDSLNLSPNKNRFSIDEGHISNDPSREIYFPPSNSK